jgi:hypothetical protein
VDVLAEIGELVEFRGRAAGTDAERRAARHLAARLEALGREARIEPVRVWPAFAQAHLLHAVAGVAGSVVGVYVPIAGFLLVLLAAVSAFGDLTGAFFLGRLPFGARASQNVVSHENSGKRGRLILVASYDARRGGALFRERLRRWPVVFFWSLMVILVCLTLRLFGLSPTFLTVIQFIPTVVLIAAVPLLADVALSPIEDGTNWNASGVATVLELAARHGGQLEHFDLSLLFAGAGHPVPLGMRAWLRRHLAELDGEATAVICLESAGHGTPHFATKEGLIFAGGLHPALIGASDEIEGARPYVAHSFSAASAARNARLPAIRISALGAREFAPDTVDPDALARTREFMSELVRRLDEEIGPRLS